MQRAYKTVVVGWFVVSPMLAAFSAAAAVPAACSAMLPAGEPSLAEERQTTDYCHTGYLSRLDDARLVPAWVAWRLTPEHSEGCIKRPAGAFAPDPGAPAAHRATPADYARSGYDRGHMAPYEDMAWSAATARESFFMTNMAPQAPHLNQWQWEVLEESERAWALALGDLFILDGPIWGAEQPATIGPDQVAVPSAFWKVIYSPGRGEALAFVMDNVETPKGDLRPFEVSVAEVERRAGISIPLPDGVDKAAAAPLWPDTRAAFRKAKAAACSR